MKIWIIILHSISLQHISGHQLNNLPWSWYDTQQMHINNLLRIKLITTTRITSTFHAVNV